MRSTQLRLDQYDSDKIANRYLRLYDPVFEPLLEKKLVLLELGIHRGGSLLLWRDYFPSATIVGIDIKPPEEFKPSERVHVFAGDQTDAEFLSRVANQMAPAGFDIIIDDASHLGESSKIAFWHLFDNHLKPRGLYVIEDWGCGYYPDWHDGGSLDLEDYFKPGRWTERLWWKVAGKLGRKTPLRSHAYGMVGLVKQLVDEQGAHDVTRGSPKCKRTRGSKFESMLIVPSIVFIKKAVVREE